MDNKDSNFGDKGNSGFPSHQTSEKFGDFEEVQEESSAENSGQQNGMGEQIPVRVRIPRKGEIIGVITQRYGGNRMETHCTDGKVRNCRVPGRYKRSLWLRPKDVVLVEPWPDDDSKGDIIFKYNPGAVNQLQRKGLLKEINSDF